MLEKLEVIHFTTWVEFLASFLILLEHPTRQTSCLFDIQAHTTFRWPTNQTFRSESSMQFVMTAITTD